MAPNDKTDGSEQPETKRGSSAPKAVAPTLPRDSAGELTVPRHLSKREFGARLRRLMLEKGWNQSELARRAGIQRDSVSVYIKGTSLPSALTLQKLADALGLKPEQLLPNAVEAQLDREPTLEIKSNSSGEAWVRVNRLVSMSTAVKLAELLQNDPSSDRE